MMANRFRLALYQPTCRACCKRMSRWCARALLVLIVGCAPGAAAQTIRFGIIGDYGGNNAAESAVAALVHDVIRPDFVVTVGDNNYGSLAPYPQGDWVSNVGNYYGDFIGKYPAGTGSGNNRFFPAVGNHDADGPSLAGYLSFFTEIPDGPGGRRYYEFVRGPVHFFMLNSHTPCEPDGVTSDSPQGQWL